MILIHEHGRNVSTFIVIQTLLTHHAVKCGPRTESDTTLIFSPNLSRVSGKSEFESKTKNYVLPKANPILELWNAYAIRYAKDGVVSMRYGTMSLTGMLLRLMVMGASFGGEDQEISFETASYCDE